MCGLNDRAVYLPATKGQTVRGEYLMPQKIESYMNLQVTSAGPHRWHKS